MRRERRRGEGGALMKLTTEKIGNEQVEIHVSPSGDFMAELNDQSFRASTRDELISKLQAVAKKAAQRGVVDVTVLGLVEQDGSKMSHSLDPFSTGDGFVHAKLRAKAEREHSTFLLISESKKKFKVSGYDRRIIARRLTVQEEEEYTALVATVRAAEQQLKAWIELVQIDPEEAMKAAAAKGVK
jgi:hypothetical protein